MTAMAALMVVANAMMNLDEAIKNRDSRRSG